MLGSGGFLETKPTKMLGIILISPHVFSDERGYFMEAYNLDKFRASGIRAEFVQDNHSRSCRCTLRGLHYQIKQPQGKLVRVVVGEVFDICVDLRRSSPTFGQWEGFALSAENKLQVWIPPGFAHGFYVTSEWAEVIYKTTNFYAPEFERTLLWSDPDIGINWPLWKGSLPLISKKDAQGKRLREAEAYE
jgi:dTDP-4-dehydrorhamnose 3,5-epimerase